MEESKEVVSTGDDIAAFDTVTAAEEGAVMEVRHPKTGDVLRHPDGHSMTITFRGKDSSQFKALAQAQSDRRISQNMRTRAAILTATVEKDDIELIVRATIKWDIILGGKVSKSNENEFRAAYTKYPWLKEQGDEFIGVRANFIKS